MAGFSFEIGLLQTQPQASSIFNPLHSSDTTLSYVVTSGTDSIFESERQLRQSRLSEYNL